MFCIEKETEIAVGREMESLSDRERELEGGRKRDRSVYVCMCALYISHNIMTTDR